MLILLRDLLRRTRQHHAIEHATLHMLAARYPQRNFAAYSDPLGFTLYGEVDEAGLRRAVGDALLRLQAGETQLAIHPNCGTNLATSTFLATLAGLAAMNGSRRKLGDRFVGGLVLVLAALVVSKPLGLWLQGYTTTPEVADRWVAEIRPLRAGALQAYRVIFE
ncbi:MAG TPA: DUF6391 domain-containing protein [Caldilineaceae bacterium]|nr:DUF6391 domain-containing protein [Caldilineaceae bacterium]